MSIDTTGADMGGLRLGKEVSYEVEPTAVGLSVDGQVIKQVRRGSQAEKLGIKLRWRLIAVDGEHVRTSKEVTAALAKGKKGGKAYPITLITTPDASEKQHWIKEGIKAGTLAVKHEESSLKPGEVHGFGRAAAPLNGCPFCVQEVTENQHAVYKSDFEKFDSNGNGVLEKDEVGKMAEHQMERKLKEWEVDLFLETIDANKDGNVSLSEYIKHLCGGEWSIAEPPPPKGSDEPNPNPDVTVRLLGGHSWTQKKLDWDRVVVVAVVGRAEEKDELDLELDKTLHPFACHVALIQPGDNAEDMIKALLEGKDKGEGAVQLCNSASDHCDQYGLMRAVAAMGHNSGCNLVDELPAEALQTICSAASDVADGFNT